MKINIEHIISSYEIKVKNVNSLIDKVLQKIKCLHIEQMQMANRLRDILAKNQNLRKKDFDEMIRDIQNRHRQRENEISETAERFYKQEKEILNQLRGLISEESSSKYEDFKKLKKRMLDNSKQREKKLARMLKNFHKEQQELTRVLRILVNKGPSVRIKDLKNMIIAFYTQHQDEAGQLDELLEEMDRAKEEISSQWNKFIVVQNKERDDTLFLDYKS